MSKKRRKESSSTGSSKFSTAKRKKTEVPETSEDETTKSGGGETTGRRIEQTNADEKLFGNYEGYRKRRTGGIEEVDDRIDLFKREWFEGKDVVDLGCNEGAMTLAVARRFAPKNVLGVDIDDGLIRKARASLRKEVRASAIDKNGKDAGSYKSSNDTWVPLSFCLGGKREMPPPPDEEKKDDPLFNVRFLTEDFSDVDVESLTKNSCDVVLLLSVTKWVHLHGGDSSIKRLFARIFAALRPSGILIIEPQPYHTYRRKIKLSDELKRNYQKIKLRPENFPKYLTKHVGFSSLEVLREQLPKGHRFNRPVLFLQKPEEDSLD
eukprot:Plantae.Rhodophyta-Purpureofilum_apyrenoidigerum.ctg830.p1 GENE.Plantae.Rhodophyta-Purpureofilum_apyrenoidigerum.ctg830~~Plantae.Rhodophyta-Purpureofilum_apyrenoidigerum.ctg830.p1  ORF type:complete len:322 (-),score=79.55 Plantae.Rhodophyta-Purpureofilum_apyrenoidigerum.ctg830:540-1505(-)